MVPVAAVLVASIRLHCLNVLLHLRYRGPNRLPVNTSVVKGAEMGWFEHGSTIIVFVPAEWKLANGVGTGAHVRAGQALMEKRRSG